MSGNMAGDQPSGYFDTLTDPSGEPNVRSVGLEVQDVSVRYGDTLAVNRVSLALQLGEVIAITGPSGCGKSTLLRAIAGLEPIETGSVRWGGADLARVPPHQRGFGMMFQDGQLFAHMSVAKNIAYGLRAQKMPKPERESRATELLDLVGLAGYGNRSVTELSGGERQRVALARSLAPKPNLLLLDEPLSALDHELRERLAGELASLLRQLGTTTILVTHDPEEAETIADRVLKMRAGSLV